MRKSKQPITKSSKTKLNMVFLDRQTAKISVLSSGNDSKYQLLTDKDVLPEKDLLEKVGTMKKFEYWPLGKELKAQIDIAKKTVSKIRQYFLV